MNQLNFNRTFNKNTFLEHTQFWERGIIQVLWAEVHSNNWTDVKDQGDLGILQLRFTLGI